MRNSNNMIEFPNWVLSGKTSMLCFFNVYFWIAISERWKKPVIPKSTLTVFHTNEPDLFLIENSQNSFQWIYIALKKKRKWTDSEKTYVYECSKRLRGKKNVEHMKPITEHICKNIQSPSRKRILPNVEIFDVIKNDL